MNGGAGITFFATHGHPFYNYSLTHGTNFGPGTYIEEFAVDRDFPSGTNDLVFSKGYRDVDVDDKYGILFSHACSTFKYEYQDYDECIGEVYLDDADGGGVAYLGNTTAASWTEAFALGKVWFDRLFNANGFEAIGETTAAARCWFLRDRGGPHRDPYTLNLGGDPKLPVWTAEPGTLTMTYTVYQEGASKTIEATVKDAAGSPVGGAYVCFYQFYYYLAGNTGSDGKIRFKGITDTFNDGKLTATKHNYRPALVNKVTVGGG